MKLSCRSGIHHESYQQQAYQMGDGHQTEQVFVTGHQLISSGVKKSFVT